MSDHSALAHGHGPTGEGDSHVLTLPDGRELGWTEFGQTDGWPVIGFHGTPGSRRQMGIDPKAAVRARVRLIAPDRPGYGLSTYQPDRRLIDWPTDVSHLADHLAIDRFSVVGVSGGGPHALVCAARLANRVNAAGVVSGVGPLSDPRLAHALTRTDKLVTALTRRHALVLNAFAAAQVAATRRWPERALDLLVRQLPASDAAILSRPELRALFARDVATASRTTGRAQTQDLAIFATDWGLALGEITVPVIFWHGDADTNVPIAHAHLLSDAVPNTTLRTFPGEGHFLVADRLEEILLALRPSGPTAAPSADEFGH